MFTKHLAKKIYSKLLSPYAVTSTTIMYRLIQTNFPLLLLPIADLWPLTLRFSSVAEYQTGMRAIARSAHMYDVFFLNDVFLGSQTYFISVRMFNLL